MKKDADIVGRALVYAVLKCPICAYKTVENPVMPWCVNCRTEYYESKTSHPRTGGQRFIFDTKRKTPRFAMGKALNACGGIRIGKP